MSGRVDKWGANGRNGFKKTLCRAGVQAMRCVREAYVRELELQ